MVEEVVSLIRQTLGRASVVIEEMKASGIVNSNSPNFDIDISDPETLRKVRQIDYQHLVRRLEANDGRMTKSVIDTMRQL